MPARSRCPLRAFWRTCAAPTAQHPCSPPATRLSGSPSFSARRPSPSSTNQENLTDASESRLRLADRHRHGDHHTGLMSGSRAASRGASKTRQIPPVRAKSPAYRRKLPSRSRHRLLILEHEKSMRSPRLSPVTVTGSRTDSHRPIALHVENYRANEQVRAVGSKP